MAAPQVVPASDTDTDVAESPAADRAWVTIVWNDPVNLMSYVTWVLQKLFGYSRDKAERLMLDVHQKGKAIVSSGPRERMEHDASRLQSYGLWATVDQP
ncbi:MAG TPA: ATP-dependent Clp protease adapter ClpS [Micromonosporaceae bacterium]|nr:ATP-dependent Clp protease adapter ClpS [Micromonosporaceae bacterium]